MAQQSPGLKIFTPAQPNVAITEALQGIQIQELPYDIKSCPIIS